MLMKSSISEYKYLVCSLDLCLNMNTEEGHCSFKYPGWLPRIWVSCNIGNKQLLTFFPKISKGEGSTEYLDRFVQDLSLPPLCW